MSSNPRRTTQVTRLDSSNGLSLKTNLPLRKGATFHSPTTPPSSPPSFKVPSLPRRSQTSLDDVVDANRRRAALTIGNVDSILTGIKSETSPSPDLNDNSLPVPIGFLDHIINGTMSSEPMDMDVDSERRVLRPRHRRSSRHDESGRRLGHSDGVNRDSDSGLGTSIASKPPTKNPNGVAAAITRSVTMSTKAENVQRLSPRAVNRIHEHTLKPLLAKPSLKEFRPIILDCPRRIQENQIVCLRDLEKTLIFMAPVSQLLKDTGVWGVTYRALCLKERAKSAELYLDFCITSIRCIQATVDYLSDREQTRPSDRPYTNGYFIDLVEQIRQHAQQMQASRERQAAGEEPNEMDVDPTDEVKLMGGLASTGRPAELVRIKKNGKAISIATGLPVENLDEDNTDNPIRFKRSMSEQLEDDEEIMRSMARRKKNASPAELAPKRCKEPGCNKEFKRPCDLTKHEKTHSRPWKCPHATCKYHEYGWPTEKEMERHRNDKHSEAPNMYECLYKPCPYKSKRESNCKQHMEKAHGWTYVRTKTNGRGTKSKDGSSVNPTPVIPSMPTPKSDHSPNFPTPEEGLDDFNYPDLFPTYPSNDEFSASNPLFDPMPFDGDIQLEYSPIDNSTPSTDAGQFSAYSDLSPETNQFPDVPGQFDDIYGAHARLPTPTHSVAHSIYNKAAPEVFTNFANDVCTVPHVSAPHISPVGQGNTMLFTPASMVDEGFDDFVPNDQLGSGDFLLFPPADLSKSTEFDNMFGLTAPSAAAGFSQPTSQDFNLDYGHAMDWSYPNQH
ncbi:hypothetical protein BJ170DRAFT_572604 [Xylariales sp. AK1849]|nr:hypothetical protein BJ170DRAFT_572604 [Xylariales sp. AK1849]